MSDELFDFAVIGGGYSGLSLTVELIDRGFKVILIEIHNDNIYLKYSSFQIHNYLLKNKFALQKRIKFPFTTWEDRIYIKKLDR